MYTPADFQLLQVKLALEKIKAFLNAGNPSLGEADTRVHFIDPLLAALGYTSIADVLREQAVPGSVETLDYVLRIQDQPRLGLQAKAISHPLTLADAAQVVQYCSVLGIEWGVVTNAVSWWLYHQFAKTDLSGMLVFKLDLLDWDTHVEFLTLAAQLLQVSQPAFLQNPSLTDIRFPPPAPPIPLPNPPSTPAPPPRPRRPGITDEQIKNAFTLAHRHLQEQLKPQILKALHLYSPPDALAAFDSINWDLFFVNAPTLRLTLKDLGFESQEISHILASIDWPDLLDRDPLGFSHMDVFNATQQALVFLGNQKIPPNQKPMLLRIIRRLKLRR